MGGPVRAPSMACVISAEVATVLAVMRRNVRWGGPIGVRYGSADTHTDDHTDHPLIQSLKFVRSMAFLWAAQEFSSVDPIRYLRPFLDIIRSDETGAPITGAALNSLHKFFALDLFSVQTVNITGAMDAVIDAVTGCRFEVTDPASEEAVLMKILQVLLGCMRSRVSPVLTNKNVCAVVNTCFRVVQQAGTKGELLQRVSRQTMQEVIRCVFSRLPDLKPDDEVNGFVTPPNLLENGSANLEPVTDPLLNQPYGIPCMIEIFEFLCSLLNIADDMEMNARISPIDFEEDVPLFALGLVHSALELSSAFIHKHPQLLNFVKDELFRNLMQFGLSQSPLVLSTVCSIVLNLFHHLRVQLKLQLEAFFSGVILVLAQSRYGVSYQQQEVALETLVDFCRQQEFMAEMYTNMDCEILCVNAFEELFGLLSKSAFPVNAPLSPLNVLALEGLVSVVQSLAERVRTGPHSSDQIISDEIDEYYPFWLIKCENVSDPNVWVQFARRRKYIKKKLMIAVDNFNKDPKKGFEYLQSVNLLPKNLEPNSIALFLRFTPGLDKTLIGDYLGHHDEFCIKVLNEFAKTFDFKGMNLDIALRLFLETFRLPGESQKIQRVLEAFSARYYEQAPHILADMDTALVLSYSLIMLNTDQHNFRVKNKMTEEDFIRNNRRINNGSDLPREFLSELYYSICRNEIRTIPAETGTGSGLPEMTLSRWLDLMAKSDKASPYVSCDLSFCLLDRDMFVIMSGTAVAAISVVFDYTENEQVVKSCINGFLSVAKLAANYHTEEALNDLVIALCKFTTLLNDNSNYVQTEEMVMNFGEDIKARMATEAVFYIANNYSDHIRSGWRSIVDCMLMLHKLGLLPAQLTSDNSSEPSSSDSGPTNGAAIPAAASQSVQVVNAPKKSYGLMGRFTQLLYLDTDEIRTQPTEEQLKAQRTASETVHKCQISNIFSESKFLHADSLTQLASALVRVAGSPQKIGGTNKEETAVFCLDLLITITLNNRDRITLLWQEIYEHISRIVQSTVMPCNLVEKAVFGLLHICQRLLPYKENLSDDLLKSLQLVLKLDARVADAYCENITQEVARLLKANAVHIRSQTGWRVVINLLSITARHPDACETGFDALNFVMLDGAHLNPMNFVLCVEAARQFADSRLVPGDKSLRALDLMAGSVSCLARWSREVKDVQGEVQPVLDGIREMWLRLVLAVRRVCVDTREEVRNHALISMQRCLVGVEGICIDSTAWLQAFEVLFQLLDELLDIAVNYSPKDYRNMEASLLNGIKLLSKALLQSLSEVVSLGEIFPEIWLGVLTRMERYLKVKLRGRRMEKLQEAIPELLKNMLLVMKASGALIKERNDLWDKTFGLVNNIAPGLILEVFPEEEREKGVGGTVPAVSDGAIQAAV